MLKRWLRISAGLLLCASFLLKLWTLNLEDFAKHNLWLNVGEDKRIRGIKKLRGFAVIGDPKNSFIVFPMVLKRLAEDPKVDFVIIVGDLTESSKVEEYWLFTQRILNFPKPVLVVPGNHDVRKAGFGWFRKIFGPDNLRVELGKLCLVLADFSNSKRVYPPEFAELDGLLSGCRKRAVVLLHIPPYDPRRGNFTTGHSLRNPSDSQRLLRILNRHHVDLVFCSHIHDFLRGRWGRLRFFITGRAGCDGKGPPHYLRVTLNRGNLKVEKVEVRVPKALALFDCIMGKVFQIVIWWRRNWIWLVGFALALIVGL